ncbi:MAG: type II secretion system ATPase GspE [Desulfobacterales bacterium]|nr:type II secretion system ATPase GspE [Desulfobacterales bacterium]
MLATFIEHIAGITPLSEADREKLLQALNRDRTNITEAAVKTRLVPEMAVLKALSGIFSMDVADIDTAGAADQWTGEVSQQFLKRCCLVPVITEEHALIAVNDPCDLGPADDLAARLNLPDYKIVLAPKQGIFSAINTFYDRSQDQARQLVEDMEDQEFLILDDITETADLLDDTSDAPVIRLVNHMISQAAKTGASDVHIEPFQDSLKIRYRIDGILYEMLTPPKGVQSALVSRVKVMAGMNIAEKRVPQDGRAQVRIGDQEIDLRISTVPTGFGERLVMRLLNKSGYFLALSEFGMTDTNLSRLHSIIRQTHGIVLVTGPTGSGKTTTLYAGLSEINSPEKSIITIEDPVEYNLEGIGQIQVNTKTGVTFAKGLRSIVRQDPDVILVGEIRDIETASIAIQSALTGHLVFSTLHTNDAAGAVTRLADLGVEPYLISSSVNTIIAQRLVRVLCPNCREAFELTAKDVSTLGSNGWVGETVFRPKGCPDCFNTGYSGRQAIFEILDLDDDLRSLILATSDANKIREAALEKGMITLRKDGMNKVLKGITSIREVLRVTQE